MTWIRETVKGGPGAAAWPDARTRATIPFMTAGNPIRVALSFLGRRINIKKGAFAYLMYLMVRVVVALMQAFPIDWNLRTARLLGKVWLWITPRHRDRAIEHVTASLGDRYTPEQIRRIAERCLQSVVMFAVEAVCLPRLITRFTWTRYIRLTNFEEVLRILLGGEGAILVTGHYGSFELTGHLLAVLGFDVAAIMRPLDNAYLNRFLVQSRRTRGLELLDKKGAAARVEALVQGGALVGFIGDQDAGRKGLFVDFFGRPASTYKSIGLLAMATGAPIIVGYARRRGTGAAYDIGVQRIIREEEWGRQADPLRWITQAYTLAIESIAREEPEQYLWIHRRWKSRPRSERERRPAALEGERPDGSGRDLLTKGPIGGG